MVQTSELVSTLPRGHLLDHQRRTQRPVLPIPYADGLIIGAGNDPGQLVVEEDGSDIIQMPIQREEASSGLRRPHLDFVVVSSGYEERLCLVEVDASDGAIVLFEAVNQGSHAVVP